MRKSIKNMTYLYLPIMILYAVDDKNYDLPMMYGPLHRIFLVWPCRHGPNGVGRQGHASAREAGRLLRHSHVNINLNLISRQVVPDMILTDDLD